MAVASPSAPPEAPTKQAPRGLRPEIQALRAGAALLVVLYHLWPGRLPGGFMGVDVFFVISGFLITSHLAREAASTGRIRLGRFWARRARRLLPAAYLVLATSALGVYLWMPLLNWSQNFREIVASALYFQNWRLALDAVDYLAAENSPSVAQHYWTLSVEEQFYVAWPLIVLASILLAARMGTRRLGTVTVVIAVATAASFVYSLWLTYNNVSFAYFSTFTRAWEFGAGALLALVTLRAAPTRRKASTLMPHLGALVSWAGLAVLVYCGLQLSGATPFPGTAALLPVLATVAVIAAGMPASPLSPRWIIERRFVQWTGDISYPLYLWHWPPIVLLPIILGHELGFWPRVGILVGSFAAAAFTKRFVEDPIRRGRRLGIQRSTVTFAFTAVAAAALVASCLGGVQHATAVADRAEQFKQSVTRDTPPCFGAASMAPGKPCDNPQLDGLLVPDTTAIRRDGATYPGCQTSSTEVRTTCSFGDGKDDRLPHVVVIGDSHARSLLPALVPMAEEGKLFLDVQVKAGCNWSSNPHPNPDRTIAESCYEWRKNVNAYLTKNADDIDAIVTGALAHPRPAAGHEELVAGFVKAWRPVAERGVPIVAVRDNTAQPVDTNDCLALEKEITADSCALPRPKAFRAYDPLVGAAQQVKGARLYDFTSFYCDDRTCPAVIGGVNVYRDRTHVSKTYMATMKPYIEQRLDQDGLLTVRGGA
ncbi:acyltransferase family protein [Aeromicrobium chenweiae]|uniref:Acyltransferase n=1 Tax=Aeromicrobium chenweiae TaxID=2079793 RepID=A0A2S0WLC9_9ACTN|nr:acyltransferase family protein [Aeromicrobium chenweiae]AWB92060.1 acyltransferase [Aeromicrobium chenweiae]TGN32909.1 acyltransferase [Aeromicrobium chenweiae]